MEKVIIIPDLNTMCRICLTDSVELNHIFTITSNLDVPIVDAIMSCAPVHITKEDGLPTVICQNCQNQLEVAYRFQKLVIQSEQTLLAYLQNVITTHSQVDLKHSNASQEYSLTNQNMMCEETRVDPMKLQIENSFNQVVENTDEGMQKTKRGEVGEFINIENARHCQFEIQQIIIENVDLATKQLFTNERNNENPSTSVLQHQCEICTELFQNHADLMEHKCLHTREHQHRCEVCNETFMNLVDLCSHKRTHSGEKLFQCDICHKTFVNLGNLKVHKRTHAHENVGFKCTLCNKSFPNESGLLRHTPTHTGAKPHECKICGKCFSDPSGLIKHHQRLHASDKLYQCNVCDKGFLNLKNLNMHKRQHVSRDGLEIPKP